MAIRHKRKTTSGYTWDSADLVDGQLGINTADGTIHLKKSDNSIVTVGAGGGSGTVTSVDVSGGTTGLSFSGGPVTTSGTITASGTLAIANGGTGATTANAALNALLPTQTTANKALISDGTNTSWSSDLQNFGVSGQLYFGNYTKITGDLTSLANRPYFQSAVSGDTYVDIRANANTATNQSILMLRGASDIDNGVWVVHRARGDETATLGSGVVWAKAVAGVATTPPDYQFVGVDGTGAYVLAGAVSGDGVIDDNTHFTTKLYVDTAVSSVIPSQTGNNGKYLTTDGSVLSWATVSGGASPLTTKGDIYTYSTADARLPVGTNGQVLTADSAEATGLKWTTPSAGGAGEDPRPTAFLLMGA